MAKRPKSPQVPKMPKGNDEGGKFVDRNLAAMKTEESLVPTAAEPVSLHKRMAGAC